MPKLVVGVVLILLLLWPPTPRALGRAIRRVLSYLRVLPHARHNAGDLVRWLVLRPAVLGAVGAYEAAVLLGNGVDGRAKYLAGLKASSLVGCPF
jgi:hypothetical protein